MILGVAPVVGVAVVTDAVIDVGVGIVSAGVAAAVVVVVGLLHPPHLVRTDFFGNPKRQFSHNINCVGLLNCTVRSNLSRRHCWIYFFITPIGETTVVVVVVVVRPLHPPLLVRTDFLKPYSLEIASFLFPTT